MEKTYLAIDLKTFYASVECVERGLDPLTAKLVVADESRTEKTICLAVTQSLKAYGLSGRSRLFEVVQKAREVKKQTGKNLEYIVAMPRMALYMEYSARIYEVYLKYFSPDDIHIYSIDEVFIDATSYLSLYKTDARSLAQQAGNAKSVNIVLMGRLAKYFHIEKEKWIEAIKNTVKPQFVDVNLKAFELGYQF